jgi:cell division protein FtsB
MTCVARKKQRRTIRRKIEGLILTVLMNFLQNHSLWTGARAAL